jgi:hypothetical protein
VNIYIRCTNGTHLDQWGLPQQVKVIEEIDLFTYGRDDNNESIATSVTNGKVIHTFSMYAYHDGVRGETWQQPMFERYVFFGKPMSCFDIHQFVRVTFGIEDPEPTNLHDLRQALVDEAPEDTWVDCVKVRWPDLVIEDLT